VSLNYGNVRAGARAEDPNLGYICPSEGVHLRLATEEKYLYLHIFYFQIYIHISVYITLKSSYMLFLKYIYVINHDKIFCLKKF